MPVSQEEFDTAWRDLQVARREFSKAQAEARKWKAAMDSAQAIVSQAANEENERSREALARIEMGTAETVKQGSVPKG